MIAIQNRITQILLVLVLLALLAVIGMLATGVRGGPLDPPGSPASSMKTLDAIPGSWDRRLNATNGSTGPFPPAGCNSDRFKCVLQTTTGCNPFCVVTYPAVLDEETGLVWERVPGTTLRLWNSAIQHCMSLSLGDRFGWRMPTKEELQSLFDTSADSLPDGHPFVLSGTPPIYFWTLTTEHDATEAEFAFFVQSNLPGSNSNANKTIVSNSVWCVRGGKAYDGGTHNP